MPQYLRAHQNVDNRKCVITGHTGGPHAVRNTHTQTHTHDKTCSTARCVCCRMFFLRLVDILNFGKTQKKCLPPPRSIWICRHPSSSPLYLIHSIYFCVFAGMLVVKTYICSTRDGHNGSSSPIKYPGDSWNVHPSRSSSSPPR